MNSYRAAKRRGKYPTLSPTILPALFPAVIMTVVRYRKIRTALRINQIVGFVTLPSWKKITLFKILRGPKTMPEYNSSITKEHEQETLNGYNSFNNLIRYKLLYLSTY